MISYNSADEYIVGVIGEHAILPCVYNGSENLASLHISSEWRRGMEIIRTAVWIEGQEEMQNVSQSIRTTVSSLATNTGDFSMELHDIHLSDAHNYSFNLKLLGHNRSSLFCTVCLTIAGKDKILNATILANFNPPHPSIHSIYLQVISAILLYWEWMEWMVKIPGYFATLLVDLLLHPSTG